MAIPSGCLSAYSDLQAGFTQLRQLGIPLASYFSKRHHARTTFQFGNYRRFYYFGLVGKMIPEGRIKPTNPNESTIHPN